MNEVAHATALRDAAPAATEPEPLEQERRTTPVELLWDLVFVFAITQVTTLLWRDLTWRGFGRAMLALALVWWAWSAFVWAANAQVRGLADAPRDACWPAPSLIFIVGLALPQAFGREAVLFAVCLRPGAAAAPGAVRRTPRGRATPRGRRSPASP